MILKTFMIPGDFLSDALKRMENAVNNFLDKTPHKEVRPETHIVYDAPIDDEGQRKSEFLVTCFLFYEPEE